MHGLQFPSLTRWLLSTCRKASWRVLKRPLAPGIVIVIERSSPRTLCRSLIAIRFRVGFTSSRMSCNRCTRCAGSSSVIATVLMIQPRMIFRVCHIAWPFNIFLIDAGSWRCGKSWLSNCRNTRSRLFRRCLFTCCLRCLLPWHRPRKSSMYTSQ